MSENVEKVLESKIIRRSSETLTLDELEELADLVQDFLKKADLVSVMKNSSFYTEEGSFIDFFSEIPEAINSNPEAKAAWRKIVEFIIEESLENFNGKQAMEFYHIALDTIKEVDIIGFFSKVTTTFTKLIKG